MQCGGQGTHGFRPRPRPAVGSGSWAGRPPKGLALPVAGSSPAPPAIDEPSGQQLPPPRGTPGPGHLGTRQRPQLSTGTGPEVCTATDGSAATEHLGGTGGRSSARGRRTTTVRRGGADGHCRNPGSGRAQTSCWAISADRQTGQAPLAGHTAPPIAERPSSGQSTLMSDPVL